MNVLITGGGGFLARGMIIPLADHGHKLRLMGRRPFDTPHERVAGDVTKSDEVEQALQGMDAMIINHMAPREPNAYATPEVAYDINVKGTANLFYYAQLAGMKKVVLVSTTGTTKPPSDAEVWRRTMPLMGNGIYSHTKGCQETIAMAYAQETGMQISILRVGYIVDADEMADKYGREISERAPLDTDRRDVGEVARLCLERDDLGIDVFPVMSTRESMEEWAVAYTRDRLGWKPRFDFDRLPLPSQK